MEPLIVTLDGPAGSGKSTVARRLAKRLGLEFLDTGAMYRGLTAQRLHDGVDPAAQPDDVAEVARHSTIAFDWKGDPPKLLVRGKDMTNRLRDPDVTFSVSDVASISAVRRVLVDAQRRIGNDHPRLVTEGRDQGSVVFPNAQVKFYLDAKPETRARRRAEELRLAGKPVEPEQILAQILQRDHRDSHRTDGPLIRPLDAVSVDTSEMTLDEVVDHLERIVRERVSELAPSHVGQSGAR